MALLSHFCRNSEIIINPRLILEISNDPDSKKRYFSIKIGRNTIFSFGFNSKIAALVLLSSLLPISVYAGLFFLKNDNNEDKPGHNIQNMALLVSYNTPLNKNSDAPETSSDALVPNSGPYGATSNTTNRKPASDQISIYVVREGDTISQIAEMFDVTVNTIKWGNNLTSNTLKVGETLVILPISGVKHTVVKGDTIASIAKKYKGDQDEIIAYNNLKKGEALAPGSVVIVPDGEVTAPASSPRRGGSSSGLKEYAGYYMRPIAGGRKTQGIHGYNGVDLASSIGTPIMAAADGEVIVSRMGGWNGGFGNYIVIRHANGTQTLYAHNSSNAVSVGETVHQGDIIGYLGSTGKSTGPHVHFEIRGARNPF